MLAIVGDVVANEAIAQARRYFESIDASRGAENLRRRASERRYLRETVEQVEHGGVIDWRFEAIDLGWPTPPRGSPDDAALEVLATMLTERLTDRLAAKQSVFYMNVRQRSMELGSIFEVSLYIEPGHDQSEVIAVLEAELEQLASPSENFERARHQWIVQSLQARDDFAARAAELAKFGSTGTEARYRALNARQVARVAADLLVRQPHVIVRREFSKFARRPTSLPR